MSDIVIEIDSVSKYYKLYSSPNERLKEALHPFGKKYHKKFYATKDMNLKVKKGEVLGIVGRNGSGKSTLLKLITGILTPSSGKVTVNGKISALLELGSGFNPEFTGMQNIYFYGSILGFTRAEMENKMNDILDFADIGEFIKQPLKNYSSGMKSRLGFSVAVHVNPDILILDEVLAVGDDLFRRKCYAKMEEFFQGGKTIIYVSHDANSVKQLCSRAIFLDKGEVLLDADPKTVTNNYQKFFLVSKSDQQEFRNRLLSTEEFSDESTEYQIDKKLEAKNTVINDDLTTFSEILILDSSSNQVNLLKMKEKYTLTFNATFKKRLEKVSFGVQFRTLKGVIISGCNMKEYRNEVIELVKPNEIYKNYMKFDCLLLPATYVITIFVEAKEGESSINYDALLFKVEEKALKQSGFITLNQEMRYSKEKGNNEE